jgi:antitoxin component YwqK of YwqJK toxin-antitoxin module
MVKKKYIKYHTDGTIWAKGDAMVSGKPEGYFEWFRKDGTRMRSGYFKNGKQTGKWTTYDKKGKVLKITKFK